MIPEEFIKVPEVPSGAFEVPVMPLRDLVVFPSMVFPLFVGWSFSIKAIEASLKGNRLIFLVLQKDNNIEVPTKEDLHTVGTIAHIIRSAPIEENRLKLLVQGIKRAKLVDYKQNGDFFTAIVEPLPQRVEILPYDALMPAFLRWCLVAFGGFSRQTL